MPHPTILKKSSQRHRTGIRRRQRGQSLVEFAISSIVLLLLMMGLLDLSRAFYYAVNIQGAVREGARHGAWFDTATRTNNWIVIYAPAGSACSPNRLNGNAFTQYIGTIYTPSASWQIQGTDKAPLAGQVVCYTATVTGNGSAAIDFNPNYAPAPPAARLIN